jgi:hypothetical protein
MTIRSLRIAGLWAGLALLPAGPSLSAESQPQLGVAPQYDTTHVYVDPAKVDAFVTSFLGTFGGTTTKQVVATVTPTPSSTTSQLLQTPVGTVSLFGFRTPVPYSFGSERTGYLVTDLDKAVAAARAAGAYVVVDSFPDPIGRDVVIQWPGGVNMQLYWHNTKPNYAPFEAVPENRIYLSPDIAPTFVEDFLAFSQGRIVADEKNAPGEEIGRSGATYERIRIESPYGKMTVLVTNGQLPYPYGRETTGYEVKDLAATLENARKYDVNVLVAPYRSAGRQAAMVEFPGGYVAEIHAAASN